MLRSSLAAVLTFLGAIPVARAQMPQVVVHIDPTPEARQFASQTGIDLAAVEAQVQNEMNGLFQVFRLRDYVRSFGDAQGFTTRGLGVDYGSNVRYVEAGVAVSTAINSNRALVEGDIRSQPVAGLATNLTVMAGVNLGALGVPVTVFGNYFKSQGSYREFDARLENLGVHLQLKLFGSRDESVRSLLVRWGGLDITTGFDRSRMRLSLRQNFTRTIPVSDGQRFSGEVALDSRGKFQMDMRTSSIPLELTTNVRFLYVLSAYVGGGFDLQVGGGSDMNITLDGGLTGRIPPAEDRAALGTMNVLVSQSASPSAGRIRGIVGLQANLFLLKIFVQLNAAPSPLLASVGFGARLVW
jgi:hypothetical protein